MNRKHFFRSLLTATTAVAIGKGLDLVPVVESTGMPNGESFKIKLSESWYSAQEQLFMQRWVGEQEKAFWYGTIKTNKYENT